MKAIRRTRRCNGDPTKHPSEGLSGWPELHAGGRAKQAVAIKMRSGMKAPFRPDWMRDEESTQKSMASAASLWMGSSLVFDQWTHCRCSVRPEDEAELWIS